jgi:hypothetical protein
MRARWTRAAVATMTALIMGLAIGLALSDSAAQDGATSRATLGAVDVPAAQQDLVDAQPVTTADPNVPTNDVVTPTATDDEKNLVQTQTVDETTGESGTAVLRPAHVTGKAVGNAALASSTVKAEEADVSCSAHPPATSALLSVGSTINGRPHHSLTWLFLAIAGLAALVAIGAILWRRRATTDKTTETPKPKTPLEIIASSVAIMGTLASLAVAYLGTGAKDHPPPNVEMKVREVHSRITHGAYAAEMGAADHLSALDRREIGNVVWLELHFTGYRDTELLLLTALFQPEPGQPLIPDTRKIIRIPIDDSSDVHSEFRPIWLGSPRVERFRAEFRILDRGQVRQIAKTGPMKGITYRYAC